MNIEEKERLKVGVIVSAILVLVLGWLYSAKFGSKEYVIVASWDKIMPIQVGDDVMLTLGGYGKVVKVSSTVTPPSTSIRMVIDKASFSMVGEGSKAWFEEKNFPNGKIRVIIITEGKSGRLDWLYKVKPVLGVDPPSPANLE